MHYISPRRFAWMESDDHSYLIGRSKFLLISSMTTIKTADCWTAILYTCSSAKRPFRYVVSMQNAKVHVILAFMTFISC